MATRKPVFQDAGTLTELAPPDTIDPDVLPPSGAAPPQEISDGSTYVVSANTQVLYLQPIIVTDGYIQIDGLLIGVD